MDTIVKKLIIKPGDIIVTDFGIYQHWSLVTDRICSKGTYMLLSATKRNGTVEEEAWDGVTQNKPSYVADIVLSKPLVDVLAAARSQIGLWAYTVSTNNCEHFVHEVCGVCSCCL